MPVAAHWCNQLHGAGFTGSLDANESADLLRDEASLWPA